MDAIFVIFESKIQENTFMEIQGQIIVVVFSSYSKKCVPLKESEKSVKI